MMYKKAIDILTDKNTDFRAVCIAIAKKHPSVIVNAYKNLDAPSMDNRMALYIRDNPSPTKIPAVKWARNEFSLSLYDAKKLVDRNWHLK